MRWKLLVCGLGITLSASLLTALGGQDTPEDGGPKGKLQRLQEKNERAVARRLQRNVETLRAMQGGWQLVELRPTLFEDAGREDVAYMIVAGDFMSIEIHLAYFEENGEELESFIQTGTYRLSFNEYGELLATLLIGSMDEDDEMTYPREPGVQVIYEAEVRHGILTLVSGDGTRFTLEKMAPGPLAERLYEDLSWLPSASDASAKRPGSTTDGHREEVAEEKQGDSR